MPISTLGKNRRLRPEVKLLCSPCNSGPPTQHNVTKKKNPMPRRIRVYGLWSVNAPMGAHDKRVFVESHNGDWPLSLFQRAVGVRLLPPSVYRRSFARMGDWKGFFSTHSALRPQRRLDTLLRKVRDDLDAPRSIVKLMPSASLELTNATGHVALWSKRLQLSRRPPGARLLARIYVKQRRSESFTSGTGP